MPNQKRWSLAFMVVSLISCFVMCFVYGYAFGHKHGSEAGWKWVVDELRDDMGRLPNAIGDCPCTFWNHVCKCGGE